MKRTWSLISFDEYLCIHDFEFYYANRIIVWKLQNLLACISNIGNIGKSGERKTLSSNANRAQSLSVHYYPQYVHCICIYVPSVCTVHWGCFEFVLSIWRFVCFSILYWLSFVWFSMYFQVDRSCWTLQFASITKVEEYMMRSIGGVFWNCFV